MLFNVNFSVHRLPVLLSLVLLLLLSLLLVVWTQILRRLIVSFRSISKRLCEKLLNTILSNIIRESISKLYTPVLQPCDIEAFPPSQLRLTLYQICDCAIEPASGEMPQVLYSTSLPTLINIWPPEQKCIIRLQPKVQE